ncbi:MAG: SpoIIE family protein phosphatase [Bryobacteraceae bacterium]
MPNETKLLLVDDDPSARAIPALFLRKWGHQVIEASDGQQALDILAREPIGLVISDWMMPNLTGVELCRRIRETQADRYTYLILCTSKGEKSDLIEGMEAGADDFLVKPLSMGELRVRVHAGMRILALERGLADRNQELKGINEKLHSAYDRIEEDLKAAAWMQSTLLPSPSPQSHGVTSEWLYKPSSYVAGDILNIFSVDEHRIGFYLLDVSGHGVPAAMLSVTLSMVLSPDSLHGSPLKRINARTGVSEVVPPAEVVQNLNQRFQAKDDRYFTMIYGLLNTWTGDLSLTQAGLPNPVLLRRGGEVTVLGDGGAPVGMLPDMTYDTVHAQLSPGDRLVLYSDGVIECVNPMGEQFGEQRLLDHLITAYKEPLPKMLTGLESAMQDWRVGREFDDDVSVLALELNETRQEQL